MQLKRSIFQIVPILLIIGALTIFWLAAPSGFQAKINWIASSVCHQLPEHSFHLQGHQFPLCARCSGAYLSAFSAMVYFSIKGKKASFPPRWISVILIVFVAFWVVDGVNSFSYEILHQTFFYKPSNFLRFVSGLGMGMVFALIIMTIFNMVFWKDREESALLKDGKDIAILFLLESGLFFFPFNKNLFVFNLAGFISTITVLTLIAFLYAILFVVIVHKEGTYNSLREIVTPLCIGFFVAILQIWMMGSLRANVTLFSIFPL